MDIPKDRTLLTANCFHGSFRGCYAGQRRLFPGRPIRHLMRDQFPSDASIAKVKTPLLVLYGDHDHVAPYTMADQLFALVKERKRMVRFIDGGHEDPDATAGRPRR